MSDKFIANTTLVDLHAQTGKAAGEMFVISFCVINSHHKSNDSLNARVILVIVLF